MWEDRFPRLWPMLERASVIVLGTLLFTLFSLPVITMPAALCGLYRAVRPLVTRSSAGEMLLDFWGGFRENLVHGTIAGLLAILLTVSAWLWVWMLWRQPGALMKALGWVFVWAGFFGLMVHVYLWPLLAWYPQTALKALKRAAMLALAHPLWALLGVVAPLGVLAVPVLLGLPLHMLLPLFILAGPALMVFASASCAWRAMKRYAPEDEFPTGPDPFEDPPGDSGQTGAGKAVADKTAAGGER